MTGPDLRLLEAVGAMIAAHAVGGRIPLIGVAGSQGSGKTTLARAAAARFGAAHLSLDDVYLTKAQRARLAETVHPLFVTRGPPGTHDLGLLNRTLDALGAAMAGDRTSIPAFDKAADDRRPETEWPVFAGRPAAVLLDGWCLGVTAQAADALIAPVNTLERERDADGVWRRAVNDCLKGDYAALSARLDALLFLRAPAFDVVLDWRAEAEAPVTSARRAELADFVRHFERLTRHMMAGGTRPARIVDLDAARRPVVHGASIFAVA